MAYVIAEPCIGTKDAACTDACPVDCIHPKKNEGEYGEAEQLFIDPVECIDCGACVPVCPVFGDLCGRSAGKVGRVPGQERRALRAVEAFGSSVTRNARPLRSRVFVCLEWLERGPPQRDHSADGRGDCAANVAVCKRPTCW